MERHFGLMWAEVRVRLEAHPEKLWTLERMEATGGESGVVERDDATGEVVFVDCSAQSPKGHRSISYDRAAREARKSRGWREAWRSSSTSWYRTLRIAAPRGIRPRWDVTKPRLCPA